jgi:hypothetical protein
MNSEYDNFIGIYRNVFEDGFCKHIVDNFEDVVVKNNVGSDRTREAQRHIKDDYHHFNNVNDIFPHYNNIPVNDVFYGGLQACYDDYINKYSALNPYKMHGNVVKIQRSVPGQGYHVWHFEQSPDVAHRVLVYILYLNTIEENNAGETEFLYLQKRIRPIENTMIVWPAGFTHTHRGNPVFGNSNKYIITGWFNFNG